MISVTWLSRSLATSACCEKSVRKVGLDAMVAEIKITKPVVCLALRKAPPQSGCHVKQAWYGADCRKIWQSATYDVSKADEIYDCLEKVGLVGSPEHQVQLDALKGQKAVCKFHASNSHATADCVAFRHAIQYRTRLMEACFSFPIRENRC